MKRSRLLGLLLGPLAVLAGRACPGQSAPDPPPAAARPVAPPPAAVFARFPAADRDAAREFYRKYLDVGGVAVLAGADVADEALRRADAIVAHLLADRPDILAAMAEAGTRLIVIGKDQVYTDMPEYRRSPDPAYLNERVRGTGGLDVTSFGEENLLNLPGDRYDDESIGLHEFCHTIDAALRRVDPAWHARLDRAYRAAVAQGLWQDAYAGSNPAEYWAELCQSYFHCNRVNNWNHNHVGTREQLKRYDPGGHDLVRATFRLTPGHDWTLPVLRPQPSVGPPPGGLRVDPYYTQFTYAREFPVLGSDRVAAAALLRANDTIRKLFAYRHDILKALIGAGARLVVLGRGEKLSDLPEFRDSRSLGGFDEARALDYDPKLKLMVVPEENVLALEGDPCAGEGLVVGLFARALCRVAAARPVIPDFDDRPRKQQYELRVRRVDVEFDRQLRDLHDAALARGLWRGTAAARDRVEYWAWGVEAYFDAVGATPPPEGHDRPIATREALRSYDPALYEWVAATMAYRTRVDWRYRR